ncbi:MAG: hypothetical protein JXQ75_22365 [Phycisphaerae bacterium]|nr:hypothetical protein [Phycisphaerae bacterium]
MSARPWIAVLMVPVVGILVSGCAAPKVDFTKIERPARATELDEYDVFVGSWTWEADMLNADDAHKKWKGTASWRWTLDKQCLHGLISSESGDVHFDAAGIWSWHPAAKEYIWWMFNNWGYPQEGTAAYDKAKKTWTMPYRSVGLDGTASYGTYCMKVVDNDTLEWCLDEWADMMHLVKKMEMKGTYKRTK